MFHRIKCMYGPKPLTHDSVQAKELVARVASTIGLSEKTVEKVVNELFEEIVKCLERCDPVTIRDFGTFFIRPTSPTRMFKFNPSQHLRAVLGWSSKYKGKKI